MIVRTTSGQHFRVEETGNPDLEHCWLSVEEIKLRRDPKTGAWTRKGKPVRILVRKAGSVVVEA